MTNYKTIPTWNEGVWEETVFEQIDDFREFIDEIFSEPGKYKFDETAFVFKDNKRKLLRNFRSPKFP